MLEASYKMNFNEKKGFICDMDGVIYHGNRILPGGGRVYPVAPRGGEGISLPHQ